MLQHTGLDDAQLGPRLTRLLAASSPLAAREMVARGLAPLAGAEPWLALYQLWVRGGATLADQASRTASDLPVAAVMTALADPHLPAVVLDFIARRRIHSPETLRLVVHHPRVHDATLRLLARCAPEGVCGAVARNQRRWLACPAIAEQLLHNPCCDRATAHAVLELGAREAVSSLAELRSRTLAGSVLQDSPAAHARAIAWMLRSAPSDVFPELGAATTQRRAPPAATTSAAGEPADLDLPAHPGPGGGLSLRPGSPAPARPAPGPPPIGLSLRPGPATPPIGLSLRPGPATPPIGLSLRPGPVTPPIGLSLRPAPATAEDPSADGAAPARARGLSFKAAHPPTDELDELDLPIADDWDELDPAEIPPPAPVLAPTRSPVHRAQPGPGVGPAAPPPGARAAHASADPLPRPDPRSSPRTYAARLELVLDPRTPLPLAMGQLHRLRVPDLRRVAAARRLPTALTTAARRRVGERMSG